MTLATRCIHVAVALFPMIFAAAAQAAPIDYTITFTRTEGDGPAPTSGTFTYDADAPLFTNFFVSWNGVAFDLTAWANNPNATWNCGSKEFGAAVGFAMLNGNTPCAAEQLWAASTDVDYDSFRMFASPDTTGPIAERSGDRLISEIQFSSGVPPAVAAGTFTIAETAAPAVVPEPATITLLASGLAGALLRRRRG